MMYILIGVILSMYYGVGSNEQYTIILLQYTNDFRKTIDMKHYILK